MVRTLTILSFTLFWLLPGTAVAQVHPGSVLQDSLQAATRQWERSPHAGSMDSPDERERMNRTGCAHCHTAQGYHQVTLRGGKSEAPYRDVVGLTCPACHEPGEDGEGVGGLHAGSVQEACRGCHDEIVANRPDYLSWCSQFGIFDGVGGAEVPGSEYPSSVHSSLEKGCVSCHMAPAGGGADGDRVGGHTFRVKTKGDGPLHLNRGPCVGCHELMPLERMAGSQDEVRELLGRLSSLLPQKPVPEDSTALEPRYPSDPTLDEAQARASFNYWMVQKDGSFGVHNPRYTRALLELSIAELEGGH